jgi:hypothetical protein
VTRRIDDAVVARLEAGGRVLLLPDGQRGSLPLTAHWFLRGGPVVGRHPVARAASADLLVELQHFDLAGDVIPDIGYVRSIDPILLLWDTHDLKRVKTHGLAFETSVGDGRLLVSALRHSGETNAAGRWLLDELLDHLAGDYRPREGLSAELWSHAKETIHEETIPLVDRVWRFRPEPSGGGVVEPWSAPDLELDESWKEIRVGKAWESQGYPALDGWAWYRIDVAIPAGWKGRKVYLSFEGVDDLYELYVAGRLVAKRGDLETRTDTFNERFSHDVTAFVEPGTTATIAVRVHDWYGAGGIFRPVTLGTTAFRPELELLR